MAAGSILIDLILRTGAFETDTQRASKALQKEFENIKESAVKAAEAIGVAFTIDAFKDMIKSSIEAAAQLDDLAKKTGIAAVELGGIGFAAKQAGGNLDSAVAGANKLNKALAEAAAGNAGVAAAFNVLGVAVKDASGNTIGASEALAKIADKFAEAKDGPEKTAIAIALFGKAGADMIPVLDKGGQALRDNIAYFEKYSGITEESARAANDFQSTQAKLNLITSSFGQLILQETLPLMQSLANRLLDLKENSDTFAVAAVGVRKVFETVVVVAAEVAFVFRELGEAIGATGAAFAAFGSGDFKSIPGIFSDYNERAREARKGLDDFTAGVLGVKKATGQLTAADFQKTDKDTSPFKPTKTLGRLPAAANGPIDDPTKKIFENQLKALEAVFQAEQDLFQTRNKFLDIYNAQNLISVQDYYDARRVILAEALTNEQAAIDKEIALAQKRSTDPSVSLKDKADATGKVEELTRRRAKLEKEAGAQNLELGLLQKKSTDDLAQSFENLKGQVLEAKGSFQAAAEIKFNSQYGTLEQIFTTNGNQQAVKAIALLRDAAKAQGEFQEAAFSVGQSFDALQAKEEYLAIAQQTGALGSIDLLQKQGEARRAQIPILEAQVAAEEAIARAATSAGTPGAPDLVKKADASRLALDKLKASADPLADSLNKAFGSSFNSAFDDFILGTKSASDAFKSFAISVEQDILRMTSKRLTESLFGGSGGLGSLLGSFLGGSGGNVNTSVGYQNGADLGFPLASGADSIPFDGFQATLHKGERVVPAAFNPVNGGGSKVVIENHGADISTQQETGPSGEDQIRLIVRQAVAQSRQQVAAGIASGTGIEAQALKSRGVGLSGSLARRA